MHKGIIEKYQATRDLLVTRDAPMLFSLVTLSNNFSSYLLVESPLRLMRCTCWLISSSLSLLLFMSMSAVSLSYSWVTRAFSSSSSAVTFANSSSYTVFSPSISRSERSCNCRSIAWRCSRIAFASRYSCK